MDERHIKLQELKTLLESNDDNFSLVVELEKFFLGTSTSGGCKCKTNTIKSKLYQYWKQAGEAEYKSIE